MKEIDFIPQWYKTGQKRILSYHRQYALVTILFVALLVWSFVAGGFISRARAQVDDREDLLEMGKPFEAEYHEVSQEISLLEAKADLLSRVRPKANISEIIAELSYLMSDRIVLSRLHVEHESLDLSSGSGRKGAVRLLSTRRQAVSSLPAANTVLHVVMSGIAAEASDVARLISKLEESRYFFRIVPGYSKNKKVGQFMAVEFEIRCYVANYIQRGEGHVQ